MQTLVSRSHSYGESSYHIVFCPKYRHDIFAESEEVKERCDELFEEIAERHGIEIYTKRIMDDHVHLFVSFGPSLSISDVVRYFKGGSAKVLFEEFPWLTEYKPGANRFWGREFWSDGYFYRSVGSVTSEAIEFYIDISQDREKRNKYYTFGGKKSRQAKSAEDPYVEFLKGEMQDGEIQKTLKSFEA